MIQRISRLLLILVPVLSIFSGTLAHAEPFTITQPTDIWFEYFEPTSFVADTVIVDGYPSDPQLWLYDEQGILLVTNDDYSGLQSHIQIDLQAGRYRLRAGTCCYAPDEWRGNDGWNEQYELLFNGEESSQISSTTTIVDETTTTSSTSSTTSTTSSTTIAPPTTTSSTTSTTSSTTSTTSSTTTAPPTTSTTSSATPHISTTAPPTSTIVEPQTTTTSTTMFLVATTMPDAMLSTTTSTESLPTFAIPNTTTTTQPEIQTPTASIVVLAAAAVTELTQISPEKVTLRDFQTVLDPKIVADLTSKQVDAIVDVIAESADNLSETELVILAETLSSAPSTVKKSFENKIDIFSGKFNTYVPTGSTVSVEKRRVLNAVVATILAVPAAVGTNPKRKLL